MARHLFLITLIVIGLSANSQVEPDSNILKRFASRLPAKDNNDFFLIRTIVDVNSVAYKKILLRSVRQLSPGIFIIEKEKLFSIPTPEYTLYGLSNDLWKLSPRADELMNSKNKKDFLFTISYKKNFIEKFLGSNPILKKKIAVLPSQYLLSFLSSFDEIEKLFLHDPDVLLIDVNTSAPREELAIGGFDLSANRVNLVHSRYPLYNGSGQHVSVKENFYDTSDIDLKGRLDPSPLASTLVTNHANFMATLIAGGGNSVYYAKGAAWASGISSSSFDLVLPDGNSYYSQNKITVQNHSYGTAIDNTYGLNAVAFDKSSNENPDLLHVISSGNSGNVAGTNSIYQGITGYANITGNFKMAKNVILVGAADSFGNVSPLSSRGPAYDGRIKPELIAFEKNGSSEAAALVSGTALLLQQYYKNKNGTALPSAFAKAILINAADDVNNPGPDHATGFGNLNAVRAMDIIKANTVFSGAVSQNNNGSFPIVIPAGISRVKITLVWNDTAANAFAPKALINDLDLTLVSSTTGEVWRPWVLSVFPHKDSLIKLPERKRDSLNNVEQVTIENPVAGNYQVRVNGFNITSASQKYYLAYSLDTLTQFTWHYPTNVDFLENGRENILRWESTFQGQGTIEYSIVPTNNWLPVVNIDLAGRYARWLPPDTSAQSVLRCRIGNNFFYSDTFHITTLPSPKVGFVCSDSILFYWDRIKGINQYQVYQLGNMYMEPLIKVNDTAVLLLKNSLTSKYFSVGILFQNGKPAQKSYAFDYTAQGTGCFIKTFFADANGNVAKLTLLLGTTYRVNKIVFQKLTGGIFTGIDSSLASQQTLFTYNYQPLSPGISSFRAKIILQNGEMIYSDVATVFYAEPGKYIIFPVPVKRNADLEILTGNPGGEMIQLIDVTGRIVLKKEILSAHEFINTSSLQPGLYFYRIINIGVKIASGKLVIL